MPAIIEQLLRQLNNKNLKVRVTVMNTLATLAHTLHSKLEPFFEKILPELESNMKES